MGGVSRKCDYQGGGAWNRKLRTFGPPQIFSTFGVPPLYFIIRESVPHELSRKTSLSHKVRRTWQYSVPTPSLHSVRYGNLSQFPFSRSPNNSVLPAVTQNRTRFARMAGPWPDLFLRIQVALCISKIHVFRGAGAHAMLMVVQ